MDEEVLNFYKDAPVADKVKLSVIQVNTRVLTSFDKSIF